MQERRREPRVRALLGGIIAFNKRQSTLKCQIRNLSSEGVLVTLQGTALVPDQFDFLIPSKESVQRARMVWCTTDAAGIAFTGSAKSEVIPLDWARKLKASQKENAELKRRVADLTTSR